MKTSISFRAGLAAPLFLAALAATGCGNTSKPHGRVVANDQPYKIDPSESLQISFIGDADAGKVGTISAAEVSPDGSFKVPGAANTGIPPGKYHITVTSVSKPAPGGTAASPAVPVAKPAPGGTAVGSGSGAPTIFDRFQGKYSTAATTPLVVEITSGNPEIVIDLGKGTVTAAR